MSNDSHADSAQTPTEGFEKVEFAYSVSGELFTLTPDCPGYYEALEFTTSIMDNGERIVMLPEALKEGLSYISYYRCDESAIDDPYMRISNNSYIKKLFGNINLHVILNQYKLRQELTICFGYNDSTQTQTIFDLKPGDSLIFISPSPFEYRQFGKDPEV